MKKRSGHLSHSGPNVLLRQLNLTAGRMQLGIQRTIKHAGLKLTLPQWRILTVLAETNRMSQSQLSSHTEKDRANVTRILDTLESSGYVYRENHSADKRRYEVVITETGREIESIVRALAAVIEQRMLADFSISERKTLLRQLEVMSDNLDF